jgi:hypothetical protein
MSVQASVRDAGREAVPFLVITGLWIVVMLAVYGLFIVTKPNIDYAGWVHASVFAVPGVGFLGHVLGQALKVGRSEG